NRVNLDIAAPFLVVLGVLVALRITVGATQRFPNPPQLSLAKGLPMLDLIIVVWTDSLFTVLGSVHYFARRKDRQVRASINRFLDQPNSVGLTLWRNRNRNRMLSRSGCVI